MSCVPPVCEGEDGAGVSGLRERTNGGPDGTCLADGVHTQLGAADVHSAQSNAGDERADCRAGRTGMSAAPRGAKRVA